MYMQKWAQKRMNRAFLLFVFFSKYIYNCIYNICNCNINENAFSLQSWESADRCRSKNTFCLQIKYAPMIFQKIKNLSQQLSRLESYGSNESSCASIIARRLHFHRELYPRWNYARALADSAAYLPSPGTAFLAKFESLKSSKSERQSK